MMQGDPFHKESTPLLLLLGDSLTQYCFSSSGGWGAILADRLQRRCDVISRGLSGYTTRRVKYYLPQILDPFDNTRLVGFTLMLGANDAADASLNKHQHVPLLEYEDNLVEIAQECLKRHSYLQPSRFLIISPPPVDEVMRLEFVQRTYNEAYIDRFNHVTECYAKACKSAAERAGVSFADFFEAGYEAGAARTQSQQEGFDSKVPHFFTDGLHLGPDGAEMLANKVIWPHVNNWTRDLRCFLPNWRDHDASFASQ